MKEYDPPIDIANEEAGMDELLSWENQDEIKKLCYFAGLLDGEGCIRIGKVKSANKKYPYDYRAYIQIGMVDNDVMKWIKENIGGNYYWVKNKSIKSKISWAWFMNPIEGAIILEKIKEYLIIKKKQAILFIEYAKTMHKAKGPKGMPKEIYDKRELLFQEMRILNKKGPA